MKSNIKRHLLLVNVLLVTVALLVPSISVSALSGSNFLPGRIIDDSNFFNSTTMNVQDIQAFLNAKVPVCDTNGLQPYGGTTRASYAASKGVSTPFTCLKDYSSSYGPKPAEADLCNAIPSATSPAADIISIVSTACGINPQVLIVLLQKEQSLITDDWPWPIQYRSATGYGCPDTAACDTAYYGFFNQVYNAARQFKRYKKSPNLFNYRAGLNAYVQFNPNASCGGSTVYIQNQATAGLYNYTPYQPNTAALANLYGTGDGCSAYGNRNFWRMYSEWFGNPIGAPDYSCKTGVNISGVGNGASVINNRGAGSSTDNLSLVFLNNTGSKCIEAHTWGGNLQSWVSNVATNLPSSPPGDTEIISGDVNGDGTSELMYVVYKNSGSGRIEVHTWAPGYQRWVSNVATQMPTVGVGEKVRVIAADTNGDGVDELHYIKYKGTGSGRIEVHTWAPGYQRWVSNIPTLMPSAESDNGYIVAGDLFGEKRDRIIFVKYTNTGSGKIEAHVSAPGYQSWSTNIATNHPVVNMQNTQILAANNVGDGKDHLEFVKFSGTGSGKIEVHIWTSNLQAWTANIATNHPQL